MSCSLALAASGLCGLRNKEKLGDCLFGVFWLFFDCVCVFLSFWLFFGVFSVLRCFLLFLLVFDFLVFFVFERIQS